MLDWRDNSFTAQSIPTIINVIRQKILPDFCHRIGGLQSLHRNTRRVHITLNYTTDPHTNADHLFLLLDSFSFFLQQGLIKGYLSYCSIVCTDRIEPLSVSYILGCNRNSSTVPVIIRIPRCAESFGCLVNQTM